ncbi:MAG: GEVED domain-containing protein [Flavobacterium sp.]|nr:GEVED domain-containing protein [Flavobacterium sp.]
MKKKYNISEKGKYVIDKLIVAGEKSSISGAVTHKYKTSLTIWLFGLVLMIFVDGNAQNTTIASNLINNNGSTTAVFTFRNANAYDVIITDLAAVAGSTATQTAELWYKSSSINPGAPGAISVVNGWTSTASASVATIGNLTTSDTQPMLSGMQLLVPANSYMRLAFTLTASLRYSTIGTQATTFTSGGCSLILGTNYGYAGTLDSPTNTPRGFIGSLTFHQASVCAGAPSPGNTTGPSVTCPGVNFQLGLQNSIAQTGLTYVWQRADDIAFTTNLETINGNTFTVTTSQTASKYYRARVTCSGSTTTSTPLLVSMDFFSNCYCTPTYSNGISGDQITNVTIGTLSNSSGASASPYYTFFNSATIPDLVPSSSNNLSISFGPDEVQYSAVWIDYNRNGVFDSNEGTLSTSSVAASGTTIISIIVPLDALAGNTRMRIRGGDDFALTTSQACGASNSTWGETEDYIVNITPPPPANNECTGAEILTIGNFGTCPATAVLGTTVYATASTGVAKTSCDPLGIYQDVFYKFNSGNNTEINLNFTNITGSCKFGLYNLCGGTFFGVCSSATYSDNIAEVIPNTDYYIIVWSNPSNSGTFSVCVSQTAPCAITTTWNGNAWSAGAPNSNKKALITNNYSSTGDLTACSLMVNNGTATVNSGHDFTITDKITINGGSLTFENNSNLIQINDVDNVGPINVKREATMRRLDYVYWGAPVDGQDLKVFSPYTVSPTIAPGFPSATGSSRFYTLNETNNSFQVITEPLGVSFNEAKGYMLRAPNIFPSDGTLATFLGQFIGVPHNGNAPIAITNTPITGKGYNMLGNPYPSTISANLFLAQNPGALYFWTHTNADAPSGANYATYTTFGNASAAGGATPNGTIAVGQGFLLKTAAGGTATFTNSMRTGNNTATFFRDANTDKHRLWLNLTNAIGLQNQILIGYMDGATQGVDVSIDAKQIEGGINNIASMIGDEKFNIQARALPFVDTDEIPLSFNALVAGEFIISIDHLDGLFSGDQAVFIKDNLTGMTHNIKESGYTFASEAGTVTDRFSVVFQNTTLSSTNPTFDANTIIVFKTDNILNINSGNIMMSGVKVFDIRGRLIFEQTGINGNTAVLKNLMVGREVLLVQISSDDNRTVTKKVIY